MLMPESEIRRVSGITDDAPLCQRRHSVHQLRRGEEGIDDWDKVPLGWRTAPSLNLIVRR